MFKWLESFSLPPENEVWGKVFSFTPVCHSVHRGGKTWAGTPPRPGAPPGSRYTPPDQVPPQTRYPSRAGTPPGAVHAGRYGQQAGGTHPTGMHSCCNINLAANRKASLQLFKIKEPIFRQATIQCDQCFSRKLVSGPIWEYEFFTGD